MASNFIFKIRCILVEFCLIKFSLKIQLGRCGKTKSYLLVHTENVHFDTPSPKYSLFWVS